MKTVYFDIDTQLDFVSPAGALYVPGSELILGAVAQLNNRAARSSSIVISTTDAHTENDPEFRQWPAHCVAGTLGQRKPQSTLLESRMVVPSRPVTLPLDGVRQVLLEKQALDCFTNPNLPELLDLLPADRYLVYGVVTEYCVSCAASGLLARGQRVEVVTDAVRTLSESGGERALKKLEAAGARLTTMAEL